MNSAEQREMNNIINELQAIINELGSIAMGLRNEFTGIGSEICAKVIDEVASDFRGAKKKLQFID